MTTRDSLKCSLSITTLSQKKCYLIFWRFFPCTCAHLPLPVYVSKLWFYNIMSSLTSRNKLRATLTIPYRSLLCHWQQLIPLINKVWTCDEVLEKSYFNGKHVKTQAGSRGFGVGVAVGGKNVFKRSELLKPSKKLSVPQSCVLTSS